jgi:hypothetical protein
MKTVFRITLFAFLFMVTYIPAQAQYENAGQYMDVISKANEKVSALYLSYISAMGNNKSARKVEKRRVEVMQAIQNTRFEIQGMPAWKGDRSYKDSTVAYYKLMYNVFNEDFGKIVNMEEIAEQSYDAMEMYMLAKEKASEKLNQASDRQSKILKEFAARHDVKIVDGSTSELEEKSKIASALMDHYGDVYLIFFKAYKQEAYLMDALQKNNLTAIEQNKNALKAAATEGMQKLQALKGYNNDPTLIVACREALQFYKDEAGKMDFASDFILMNESFAKMKKTFDTKPASQRTQKDVDEFNRGVNDINNAGNKYNNTNKQMDKERQKALDNWNKTVTNYLDEYMPKYKA